MAQRWQQALIHPSQSIRDALQCMNDEALRLVMVVDEQQHLIGVVTDGDIRRGLLGDLTLDHPVQAIMNTSPATAAEGTSKASLVRLMKSRSILSVPLVKDGKVVGLETLQHALDKQRYHNPVFIMAGGLGTRLRPLTDECPKPMLKVGDKPILETILQSFIDAGFSNFYISTHYMPEKIQDYFGDGSRWGVDIHYVHEASPLGTGGALGLLPDDLPDLPIIMINGDILTKVDFERLLNFHNDSQATATMCVREYEYQIPYGVINGQGIEITSMEEKPIQRFFINAGIYVVSPELARSVPKNQPVDMPSLLDQRMQQQEKVVMFPIHEYWLDIGRMDDFHRAQADIYTFERESV
ncbi:Arabinose 5-phosphate isomerase GutQ [Saliniradius amylolyticus]|uniref:Arabinose 5-phosphate isomerase GutQ n=1 Tax=Saliniradius amylolyticus TaxID=2183582 RepID=A0A2S2E3M6_9ALTE|nr:nucleotidyltransferase family protein [Saliniradius amylolyticus]AWL11627.1 Arabinose 5-phosphate isomerase GutQ [Saliniradius amylolyticus]